MVLFFFVFFEANPAIRYNLPAVGRVLSLKSVFVSPTKASVGRVCAPTKTTFYACGLFTAIWAGAIVCLRTTLAFYDKKQR